MPLITTDDLKLQDLGLSKKNQDFGLVYRTESDLIAADTISLPYVDENELSVRMRISTDVVDREKMVIRQEGILLDLYKDNPVVLYGHAEEDIKLPVASSMDRNGQLWVWREKDGTYAKGFHRKRSQVSMQVFDAVACGLLRASSVGLTPISFSSRYDAQGRKIPVVDSSYLNEWSYCAIGVNPESFTKSWSKQRSQRMEQWATEWNLQCATAIHLLNTNRLNGEPIIEPLKRLIKSLVPGRGRAGEQGADMAKSLDLSEIEKLDDLGLAMRIRKSFNYDWETRRMLNEETDRRVNKAFGDAARKKQDDKSSPEDKPAKGPVEMQPEALNLNSSDGSNSTQDPVGKGAANPAANGTDEANPQVDGSEPNPDGDTDSQADNGLGDMVSPDQQTQMQPDVGSTSGAAVALAGLHTDLAQLIATAKASILAVDPKVVQRLFGQLQDVLNTIEMIHKQSFPNSGMSLGQVEPDVTAQMVKSFLSRERDRQARFEHIFDNFDRMASGLERGVARPSDVVKSLRRRSDDLKRIVAEAKLGESQTIPKSEFDAVVAEREQLYERYTALRDKTAKILEYYENKPAAMA